MRHVKSENPSSQAVYTIRVERDMLEELQVIAASQHRTLAGEIRVMFSERIARHREARVAS